MTIRNSYAVVPALLAAAVALGLAACSPSHPPDETRSSSAGLPQGFVAAGETQANAKGVATGQSCIDCHGVDGNAPIDSTYPVIGGQYADYLGHALQTYRDGSRDHVMMAMQAKDLTDQQIANLSAYFASRPSSLVTLEGSHQNK